MTFYEAIKILGEGVFSDNVNFGDSTFVSKHEITNLDMIQIINDLRKEYAPTIEMTEGQFKTILDPKEGKSILGLLEGNTQYFDYLFWEPLTEKQIVQAWLHPETIKVIGEISEEEED